MNYNISESGLIVTGQGRLKGAVINSHSSGTMKIYDGTESGAAAVGTITQSVGAAGYAVHGSSKLTSTNPMVAATHATTVFTKTGNFLDGTKATGYITSNQSQPTVGQVVVLGARTYTFRAMGGTAINSATAVDVPLGNNAAQTMNNLYNAFITDPLFDVVHTSTYVITVTYKTIGTAGNVTATENSTTLAWDDGSTLTGGTNAETITLGTKVYTWKDALDTDSTATAVQVLIGATLTASLLNLKNAINADSDTLGKTYGFKTTAHSQVVCSASDATTVTLYGRVVGTSLNAVATTETCADGTFPDTTLGGGTGASDAGVATTGAIITVGTDVYTVVDILSETLGATAVPYEVLKGATEATMLDNFKSAFNGTTGAGTTYGTGTVANTTFIATTNTDTEQTIVARTVGGDDFTTALNLLATTTGMANTSWTGTTIGGATAAVTTSTAGITIGTREYIAVSALSETSGAAAVKDQILWVSDEATFLDNLKKAINATGIAGTDYSTGTVANSEVVATTNGATTQVIQARNVGVAGNSIATTATLTNYAWGATTLASGTGATGKVMFNTITFSAVATTGERCIDFFDTAFTKGLYVTIGGTSADVTLVVDID